MRLFLVLLTMLVTSNALAYDIIRGPRGQRFHTGLIYEPNRSTTGTTYYSPSPDVIAALPDEYDSRADGYVPPIRNQGNCGSCWAFSMTKAFEGALMLANDTTYKDLSEQDWVSNDRSAHGCGGGYMDADFAVDTGLLEDAACPYQARSSVRCSAGTKTKAVRWGFVGARNRTPTADELKAAIYQYKVLSVTVAAGSGFGNPNSDGVVTGCSARSINHMVTLVGWKHINGVPYFLVANSWGTGWGKEGFAYSKQGCNVLASTNESALYIVAEEGPAPLPPIVQLPVAIDLQLGTEVVIGVRPEAGVTYLWSTGETSSTIYVKPLTDTDYTLKATNAAGSAESTVRVKVIPVRPL